MWSVPVTGGDELRLTNSPHLGYWGHFAVVEDGIYLVDADAKRGPSILYYSFRTRHLISVLTFKKGQHAVPWTANLSASRDGLTLFFAQGSSKNSNPRSFKIAGTPLRRLTPGSSASAASKLLYNRLLVEMKMHSCREGVYTAK